MFLLPGRSHGCDLGLSEEIPLELDLDLALADGRIDLSSARVSRVSLDGAFNDLTLRLGATESEVRVTLNGAFNQLRLEVPAATRVRVSTDGILNFVDDGPGARSRAGPGYRLLVDGAFNRLLIRSADTG